jgi:transcriptional regulator with XRE-family HTH domain
MSIVDKIKILRKSKRFTQGILAQRAGVSLPTIQNIEAGRANPSILVLEKILGVLGASLEVRISPENIDILELFNMDNQEFVNIDFSLILQSLIKKENKHFINQSREQDLLGSLVSALLDHYPLWLKQNNFYPIVKKVNDLINSKIDPNRMIKFRRIWLSKICQVL